MPLRALAFDFGHTLMNEREDADTPLEARPIHLMPEVRTVLPQLHVPMAVWANTRVARESEVRRWLARADLEKFFTWVVTSVDAGYRKPQAGFFEFALARCGVAKGEVLFVGNQLSTDIQGGEGFGIRTVWLAGLEFRSDEDYESNAPQPSYTILALGQLPALVRRIQRQKP